MRSQFSHVVDIAPTIYDVLKITPPEVVNGFDQLPIDGTSFAYTFTDATAPNRKHEQFFDNNGSRGIWIDGWFAGTELTPRDGTMAAWDSIPADQRAFQERLMEVYAGFVEHTDTEVGRLVDGMAARGLRDNTLVFYIFGDNGSSAEGQQGSISELLAQNNIPNTVEQQMAALERIGGLEVLGIAYGQHVPCRMGVGGGDAVQGDEAAGLVLRGDAQPDGGVLAGADRA
jgi:arylsulfatase A-like enzyme